MNIFLKSFLFLLSFSLFHFGYELTGWVFLKPFCGINESVFQHLKMAFWGYTLLTGAEFLILKKKGHKIKNFFYSRMLSTIIIPWIMILTWYLLPAIYGRAGSLILDLTWAVLITYLCALFVIQIEKETEKIQFNIWTKVIISILYIISVFLFILFTYKLPWIDLFINPEAILLYV
jgi:hypothetical protein